MKIAGTVYNKSKDELLVVDLAMELDESDWLKLAVLFSASGVDSSSDALSRGECIVERLKRTGAL